MSRSDLFLVITEEGSREYFGTLPEAAEYALHLQEEARIQARRDGGWPLETQVSIYRLVQQCDVIDLGNDEHDYTVIYRETSEGSKGECHEKA